MNEADSTKWEHSLHSDLQTRRSLHGRYDNQPAATDKQLIDNWLEYSTWSHFDVQVFRQHLQQWFGQARPRDARNEIELLIPLLYILLRRNLEQNSKTWLTFFLPNATPKFAIGSNKPQRFDSQLWAATKDASKTAMGWFNLSGESAVISLL